MKEMCVYALRLEGITQRVCKIQELTSTPEPRKSTLMTINNASRRPYACLES